MHSQPPNYSHNIQFFVNFCLDFGHEPSELIYLFLFKLATGDQMEEVFSLRYVGDLIGKDLFGDFCIHLAAHH